MSYRTLVRIRLTDAYSKRSTEAAFSLKHSFAENLCMLNRLLTENGEDPLRPDAWVYEKNTMRHYDEYRILESMNISDGMSFILF